MIANAQRRYPLRLAMIVWSPLPGSQAQAVSCPMSPHSVRGYSRPGQDGRAAHGLPQARGSRLRSILARVPSSIGNTRTLTTWLTRRSAGSRSSSMGRSMAQVHEGLQMGLANWRGAYCSACSSDEDYWKYHGQEFAFIAWNELTKFPTSKLYDDMMSVQSHVIHSGAAYPEEQGRHATLTPDGKPLPEIPARCIQHDQPLRRWPQLGQKAFHRQGQARRDSPGRHQRLQSRARRSARMLRRRRSASSGATRKTFICPPSTSRKLRRSRKRTSAALGCGATGTSWPVERWTTFGTKPCMF
jgi:hypothetical protein